MSWLAKMRVSNSATTSSSRRGAEQRKALEKTWRGSSARSNAIGDGRKSLNKSSTQFMISPRSLMPMLADAGGAELSYATSGRMGESVAVMGGGAQSAVAKAGGGSETVLYVEFRKKRGVP
jgi:hypothetical protein